MYRAGSEDQPELPGGIKTPQQVQAMMFRILVDILPHPRKTKRREATAGIKKILKGLRFT